MISLLKTGKVSGVDAVTSIGRLIQWVCAVNNMAGNLSGVKCSHYHNSQVNSMALCRHYHRQVISIGFTAVTITGRQNSMEFMQSLCR